MEKLIKKLNKFNEEREWGKFHTPENLAKSIVLESAELLENFQWDNHFKKENLEDELADIFLYCLMFAEKTGIDLLKVANEKIDKNEIRYAVQKAKGNSKKYSEL